MASEALKVSIEKYPLTKTFRDSWKRLYRDTGESSPFLRLEWIESVWRAYGKPDCIARPVRFLDRRGNAKAAGFFLETDRQSPWGSKKVWASVSQRAHAFPPMLALSGDTMASAMIALHASEGGRFDAFEFSPISNETGELDHLRDSLQALGASSKVEVCAQIPKLVFTDSWEESSSVRSKSTIRNLRRLRRLIADEYGQVDYLRLRFAEDFADLDLEALLEELRPIIEHGTMTTRTPTSFEDELEPSQAADFLLDVVQAMAPLGCLDLGLLYAGGKLLAFDLSLIGSDRLHMIAGGYDRSAKRFSPGRVLFFDVLADSHERGDRFFEITPQQPDYKVQWAGEYHEVYRLSIPGKTLLGQIRSALPKS